MVHFSGISKVLMTLLLFVTFKANAQCLQSAVKERKLPKFSFENNHTVLKNKDTINVFSTDSLEYAYANQLPDSSNVDGTWVVYYHNNPDSILLRCNYLNGVIHGIVSVYDFPGGILKSKENYKNGKLHKIQYYYYNGALSWSKSYNEGELHGEIKGWHYNGELAQRGTYLSGLKHGAFYSWDTLGRIVKNEFFIDGKNEGSAFYFKNGKLKLVHYFQNGKLKKGEEYFLTPMVYSKKTRRKKHNKEIEFIIKEEAVLADSLIFISNYFPSGQLKSKILMIRLDTDNCEPIYLKTGEHKFWNEDGKLIRTKFYENDNLIKEQTH